MLKLVEQEDEMSLGPQESFGSRLTNLGTPYIHISYCARLEVLLSLHPTFFSHTHCISRAAGSTLIQQPRSIWWSWSTTGLYQVQICTTLGVSWESQLLRLQTCGQNESD